MVAASPLQWRKLFNYTPRTSLSNKYSVFKKPARQGTKLPMEGAYEAVSDRKLAVEVTREAFYQMGKGDCGLFRHAAKFSPSSNVHPLPA